MPSIKSDVLQSALDAVFEAAGADNVEFVYNTWPLTQVVYNATNWEVCSQYPSSGDEVEIESKPTKVYVTIARPSGC